MPNSSGFEIFRDSGNLYKRIRPRKRIVLGTCILLALVLAGNAWWLESTLTRPALEAELAENLKSDAMLAQSLERLKSRTTEIREGVDRLRAGDAKLREMIRLDKEASRAAQAEGKEGDREPGAQALLKRMEVQEAFVRKLNQPSRLTRTRTGMVEDVLARGPSPLGAVPDAWPVRGVISSEFGVRLSPFAGREEFHTGLDIMAPAGSPVRAPAPAEVTFAGEDAEGTQAVVLDHGGGYVTVFSHMQRLDVRPGERVLRGQDIGAVGQDGRSTGPHLHYEVRLHGAPVNPAQYLGLPAPAAGNRTE